MDTLTTSRARHWDQVYTANEATRVSWYQGDPRVSLELIQAVARSHARVIDVGGGASLLVDRLLDAGFEEVAVLDISRAALERARGRLGGRAERVRWIAGDVTAVEDVGQCDVWHDRAVFHFLTLAEDRRQYVELATRTLPRGGHLVIGTFAPDGPSRCSGLEIRRYDAASLCDEFGPGFKLVRETREVHNTPFGRPQPFVFILLAKR